MKLLLCPHCSDIKRLSIDGVICFCGKSWAQLRGDYLHAVYGGDGIPLGIANRSLADAVRNRPQEGLGSRFEAFVIPVVCETVERESFADTNHKRGSDER